ncbi:MAG: flavodoxin domain-containing protein [Eubacteriales bacterium]|nr:flavodoxin domain-containing protein [Eubacteriales bacterium]
MMNNKVLVVYKSISGFTRKYAEMISQEIDCTLMDFKEVNETTMSNFDTVIFGGRLHAGTVDGLKNAKKLFMQSKASQFVVYATGAMPNESTKVIEEMWGNNLSPEELSDIPHFYMQGGISYERLPLSDKLMMKIFSAMLNKKKDKTEDEKQMAQAISGSYDISSKDYIMPLISSLKSGRK